jgi:hypothetical protein
MVMRKAAVLAVFFLVSVLPVFSDSPDDIWISDFQISWETGEILFDITARLPEGVFSPGARYKTEQRILQNVPSLFVTAVSPLVIDSWYTIEDRILENPDYLRDVEGLTDQLERSFSVTSEDMSELTVRFNLDVFPYLASLFFAHEIPRSLPREAGFVPTADFSGILIVADEPLPETGTDRIRYLQPCLFPRVFDENMRLLLDSESTVPEDLARWGTAGYITDGGNLADYEDRIGVYPLRIIARGLFGKNGTDVIITEEDAARLLISENNRQLLREGRVVILYSPVEAAGE